MGLILVGGRQEDRTPDLCVANAETPFIFWPVPKVFRLSVSVA